MYLLISLCDNSSALSTIYLMKTAISLITIIVPIILILSLMISIVKYIISGDENVLAKTKTGAVNKIIAALVVFIVPLGVNLLLQTLNTGSQYQSCYTSATADYIAQRKQEEKLEKEIEKAQRAQEIALKKQELANKPTRPSGGTAGGTTGGSTGGTGDGNYADPEAQSTTKYASQLVYYNQYDYSTTLLCDASTGKTIQTSGCGHTSLAMIAATFGNKVYKPSDIRNIMCGNKEAWSYDPGALGHWYYTYSPLLNQLGLTSQEIVKHDSSSNTYNSAHASAILSAVQAGKGVILYIPGHYIAVGQHPSCTTNQVYNYDPGNRSNRGCYTMRELWDKTYNYSNRCANNGNCGWKGAWAFVGK